MVEALPPCDDLGMDYLDLHRFLKGAVEPQEGSVQTTDGLRVSHVDFHSASACLLPGEPCYACAAHGPLDDIDHLHPPGPASLLDVHDAHVSENRAFRYPVFHSEDGRRAREAVLLFHGFNEKHWHKYLPWAHRLAVTTGKAVVLFPLAFHMNRAPHAWSDSRLMHRICAQRRVAFPEVIASSLSNVAISTRLQARPQRFIWSGLQSYCDAVQLLEAIREGGHPLIDARAQVDILAYSIGGLLAQVLLMTDPGRLLPEAKLCLFCSGAVFNRTSPVSKFILDSAASVALYSYLVEHLESHLRIDARLRHYLAGDHAEGWNLRSLLAYGALRSEREAHFRRLAPRLLAVTLEQDKVIPSFEVRNTLQGAARNIPVPVEVLDFPYPHTHEDPFPAAEPCRKPVDAAFQLFCDRVAAFLAK